MMTDTSTLPLADPSDMVQLHRVFRNALSDAPRLVPGAAQRDGVDLVGSYYSNVLRLVHAHHEGEDDLLTPKLVERRPEHAARIREIAGQHLRVAGLLEDAERAIYRWRSDPDVAATAALVGALAKLNVELSAHLDTEEQEVLPLVAECINVAEWGELPAQGLQRFDGDKLWLVIGLIRQELSPKDRAEMDLHLPPPVASVWSDGGEQQFAAFRGQLFAREEKRMDRTQVNPWTWQDRLGFSQAWSVSGTMTLHLVSGQAPIAADGSLVGEGDFDAQVVQVFDNLTKVLESAGAGLSDVVKITAYLTDITKLPELSRIKANIMPGPQPASTAVGVSALALPGMMVEVEAVAVT